MVVDRSKLPAKAAAKCGGRRRGAAKAHTAHVDNSAVKSAAKKAQCQPLPGFDEVQLFLDDEHNGDVLRITKPELSGNIKSNCFVVPGAKAEQRPVSEFWKDLIGNRVTPEQLQQLAELQAKAQEQQ